jgi:prepilin-type N-terminal cleavage/methylation domain-containing protein
MAKIVRSRRQAFTLLELLSVILIIAVLTGLLMPVLSGALKYANQVKARTEIAQLDAALQNFQADFGVTYVPSRIKLCKWLADYGTTQLDIDSVQYLLMLFPKIATGSGQATAPSIIGAWSINNSGVPYPTATGINWSQDYATWTSITSYPASGPTPRGPCTILEGHQALVFFLGGIETTSPYGCIGFSTNPLNPSDTTASISRRAPYFEFTTAHLTQVTWNTNSLFPKPLSGSAATFLSYNDPIGNPPNGGPHPYAFFSSYKSANGYNRTSPTYSGYGTGYDNATLGISNGAYYINGTSNPFQYLKPDTYQIICSGSDGQLGAGGAWALNGSLSTGVGADDLCNFASGKMSAGQ